MYMLLTALVPLPDDETARGEVVAQWRELLGNGAHGHTTYFVDQAWLDENGDGAFADARSAIERQVKRTGMPKVRA